MSASAVDFDGNGYDDVWQQMHHVALLEFPPDGDYDNDGSSNRAESVAGTDPRDPTSVIRSDEGRLSEGMLSLKVPTEPGKTYQLQQSDLPGGSVWSNVGERVEGNGAIQSFEAAVNPASARLFYRVSVADLDSDGDGASDWAEIKTGTNPALVTSPSNASGGTAGDGETLRSLLSLSLVPASGAEDAFEKEGQAARLRLTRTFGSMKLVLPFQKLPDADPRKATASLSDYSLSLSHPSAQLNGSSSGTLLLPAGQSTLDIIVSPTIDALPEVPEAVRLSFNRSVGSGQSLPLEGAVSIADADPAKESNQTLFVAYLGRESGAVTTASGVATALVAGDRRSALLNLSFNNLTSAQNTAYLRIGSDQEVQNIGVGQINDRIWPIQSAQTVLSDQAMLDALFRGELYVSVTTAQYSGGEIRGNLQPANGSVAEPPAPAAPPAYGSGDFPNLASSGVTNNPELDRDIARFLTQATFGPTPEGIQEVKNFITANGNDVLAGYEAWITRQQNLAETPSPSFLKLVQAADVEEFILRGNKPSTFNSDPQFGTAAQQWNNTTRTWVSSNLQNNNHPNHNNRRREWWTLVLQSPDQLRQRVAFALSQIFVISDDDNIIRNYHYGAARYWDQLAEGAFGNYRSVLENVTYSPMMGQYLSHLKNQKATGSISPDENYAREIMQLFSIGLVLRHPDGSLKLGPAGLPISTYDQTDISELARVFTGLSFSKIHSGGRGALTDNTDFFAGNGNRYWQGSWTNPMKMFGGDLYHDYQTKTLFAGKVGERVIPARAAPLNENKAVQDVTAALVALAGNPANATYNGHPNTPIFVSRLLIQRFTTSNPSAGYLHRVATRFRETKGDLSQVIRAILLDFEARSLGHADHVIGHGKLKEPLLHFAASLRAFKGYTGAPLANLSTLTVPFTSAQSPVTTPYEASELGKFPAGALRFRFAETTDTLAQSPQSAPTVFNWFLPDYVLPGPLASAGLVAPEFQVITESNLVNITNYHYQFLFAALPPAANAGRGLNPFFNLSAYRSSAGVQRTVPNYGVSSGYFTATQFNPTNQSPGDIETRAPHLLPGYGPLVTLYKDSYHVALPAGVTTPTPEQKRSAHNAAIAVVADHLDLLLATGALKARYQNAPAPNPRSVILNATTQISNNNRHSDESGFDDDSLNRIRNLGYLIATSPQALTLR